MELIYAQSSVTGPVRERNEDSIGFWKPDTPELIRSVGIAAILADGVGGTGLGQEASQLAVGTALKVFHDTQNETEPADLLRAAFNQANKAVYDAGHHGGANSTMATTFTISIFRHDELNVGHVGDCRVYLIRNGTISRVTADHSYVALQVKLGLVKEHDAMGSPMRSMITRSLGQDLICGYDVFKQSLIKGDIIVQCTDGVYAMLVDDEIRDIASHCPPDDACRQMIELAEKRKSDDNMSVQVVQINEIEHRHYYRGTPYYTKGANEVSNEIQPGHVLDDRFEITDVINRSGMASIFKARDRQSDSTVALKVPHMQFESDTASFSRFQREEEIGKLLVHPYILRIFPVDSEKKSRPYMVMEYLQGQTLADLLKQVHPLPEPDAARIASRICEALEYMHAREVVHRDLKPQNIMVCSDGAIRIMDFGIAKSQGMRRLTFVGFSPTMGTPDYMAPEQVRGKRGDARTDIYALGCILYEMTTGQTPFEGESPYIVMNARVTGDPVAPRRVNPKISQAMEEIILHAMEREPARRYASAGEMKAELDDYEKVDLVGRFRNLQEPQVWKSRFRNLPLIVMFFVFQILLGLAMFWFLKHHGK